MLKIEMTVLDKKTRLQQTESTLTYLQNSLMLFFNTFDTQTSKLRNRIRKICCLSSMKNKLTD